MTVTPTVPEVLFVCVHNAGRSQMAAALLDHHAQGAVHVRSAGSTPAAEINPAVREVMAELGLDLSREFPKPLTTDVVEGADVVITGEGAFDFSSRSGKVPSGVAAVAAEALRPCVAIAGAVLLGSREMRTMGVEAAYSLVDIVGEEAAFADPAGSLATVAERVARSWSR